jgi:hypothetical protein
LREWARIAPRERLGIDHVYRLLHRFGYMHTLEVFCNWDLQPFSLQASALGQPQANIKSCIFKQTPYFEIADSTGHVMAYIDAVIPKKIQQTARVRDGKAALIGSLSLSRPIADDRVTETPFEIEIRRADEEQASILLKEQYVSQQRFLGTFYQAFDQTVVGSLEDKLERGKVKVICQMDLPIDERLLFGIVTNVAELARLRKRGWPDQGEEAVDEFFGDIESELGPSRKKG